MALKIDEAIAKIAADNHGIFALHHLDDLEVTREFRHQRLACGRWEAVHDSAYRIAGAPRTWRSDLLAGCWAGGTRTIASHRSAAALWELPSARRDVVELTCPRWRRARHDDLIVHETTILAAEDHTVVDGIPCTSAERTLFDLARRTSPVMLDANIDAALRRDLVTLDHLVAVVERLATKGRPGAARFRAVIAERRGAGAAPAESVPERLLAAALLRHGLPAPTLQYEVRAPSGEFVARVDLAYPEWRILIEYDSFEHHVGKLALVRDGVRRNALQELGFTVLTATAFDVRDSARRLAASIRRLRERTA
jgi:very-short-patch-repair endonuclease